MGKLKRTLIFISLTGVIITLSLISSVLWGDKPEKNSAIATLDLAAGMSIREFATRNGLPLQSIQNVFPIKSEQELDQKVEVFGISESELLKKTNKALALSQEYQSKNWLKIPVKFALWVVYLAAIFLLFKHERITVKTRILLYASSVVVFGILLGSDPSPMGTVKDAIVLFGRSGAIFPPRMIALSVFILLTIIANKFICSWGCQFGTLQDLLFRINRDRKDIQGFTKQIKIPFVVSNGIRVVFFIVCTGAALFFALDVVEIIDPFKIFNPSMISIAGGVFLSIIIPVSMFIYRPWCHLFCPFGLVSWLFEKVSVFKILVNYETCIACEKCTKACPSNVMKAILKRGNVIPDCFSCGTCINACPTGSIKIGAGKRLEPPKNKFNGRQWE